MYDEDYQQVFKTEMRGKDRSWKQWGKLRRKFTEAEGHKTITNTLQLSEYHCLHRILCWSYSDGSKYNTHTCTHLRECDDERTCYVKSHCICIYIHSFVYFLCRKKY